MGQNSDAAAVDYRRRPGDPPAPPGDDSSGWVIVGEEPPPTAPGGRRAPTTGQPDPASAYRPPEPSGWRPAPPGYPTRAGYGAPGYGAPGYGNDAVPGYDQAAGGHSYPRPAAANYGGGYDAHGYGSYSAGGYQPDPRYPRNPGGEPAGPAGHPHLPAGPQSPPPRSSPYQLPAAPAAWQEPEPPWQEAYPAEAWQEQQQPWQEQHPTEGWQNAYPPEAWQEPQPAEAWQEPQPAEAWQETYPAEAWPVAEADPASTTGGNRRSRLSPGPRRRETRHNPRPVRTGETAIADDESRSWLAVATWTLCYFAIPMLLYLAWALTRSAAAESGCVDAAGAACLAPRTDALVTFVDALPAMGGAFVVAVVASVLLRPLTEAWRPGMIGFASAVIGTGLATLVVSILG